MLHAIAYIYEDLPRYDRVERVKDRLRYFDKGVEVFYEPSYDYIVNRHPILGLVFVNAETKEEAYQKFVTSFPKHITALTVNLVPPYLNP